MAPTEKRKSPAPGRIQTHDKLIKLVFLLSKIWGCKFFGTKWLRSFNSKDPLKAFFFLSISNKKMKSHSMISLTVSFPQMQDYPEGFLLMYLLQSLIQGFSRSHRAVTILSSLAKKSFGCGCFLQLDFVLSAHRQGK